MYVNRPLCTFGFWLFYFGGGIWKGIIRQIGKYAYSRSCQDLYEEIDNTVICFCLGWRW